MTTVLVCTVGGSPEPIVTAVRQAEARFVIFICTEDTTDDQGKVRPGSRAMVEGQQGIAAKAGRYPDNYEVRIVPADDPDAAYLAVRLAIEQMRRRFENANIRVDYTGGTKSMTAAAVYAGVAEPEARVELQFMAGKREDLVRIASGTERPMRIRVDAILAERTLEACARAWKRFAYDEAVNLLGAYTDPEEGRVGDLPESLAERVERIDSLSRGFAAWDSFDHGGALAILDPLAANIPEIALRLPALRSLTSNAARVTGIGKDLRWLPPEKPLVPLDLWRNAQRCAARGRFDDAIARCYRLVEATAQWILWTELRIDTGKATRDQLGAEEFARLARGRDLPSIKLGLENGCDIVRDRLRDHWLTSVLGRKGKSKSALSELLAWKERRNQSILAHGFEPLTKNDWKTVESWVTSNLERSLAAIAQQDGCHLDQLPTSIPV